MDQMEQGRFRMAVNTALKTKWDHSAIKNLSLKISGKDKLEGEVGMETRSKKRPFSLR